MVERADGKMITQAESSSQSFEGMYLVSNGAILTVVSECTHDRDEYQKGRDSFSPLSASINYFCCWQGTHIQH